MKTEIVEFHVEHALEILEKRPRVCDAALAGMPNKREVLEGYRASGPAYTVMRDGEPVGCGGVGIYPEGTGAPWAVLSTVFWAHRIEAYRVIRDTLRGIALEYGLRTLQALVLPSYGAGKRMLQHLGFGPEKVLIGCGPNGEDFELWRRTL